MGIVDGSGDGCEVGVSLGDAVGIGMQMAFVVNVGGTAINAWRAVQLVTVEHTLLEVYVGGIFWYVFPRSVQLITGAQIRSVARDGATTW